MLIIFFSPRDATCERLSRTSRHTRDHRARKLCDRPLPPFHRCVVIDAHSTSLNPPWSFYHLRQKNIINKTVSDEAVEKLGALFSEQLLLAALDLIDRDCGMRKHRLSFSSLLYYHVKKARFTSRA
jgi:hypothetical protein